MLDLTPFRLLGHDYRIRDIPDADSRHIWSALNAAMPHLCVLVPAESDEAIKPFTEAVADALCSVPAPERAVLGSLALTCVQRRRGMRWTPVWDRPTTRLLYEDISLEVSDPAAARALPPGAPNIPMPAGQMLRAENNHLPAPVLNQTTNVTVNGVSDPKQAARSVEDAQTRVNGNMVRNFLPAAY
jgi:hypothetical protein